MKTDITKVFEKEVLINYRGNKVSADYCWIPYFCCTLIESRNFKKTCYRVLWLSKSGRVPKRIQEQSCVFMIENKLRKIFLKVNDNTR